MAGFTITGGVSFSGAVSMSDAPPPTENTAAWFGGAQPGPASTVQRITFATDTATASVRGPLSLARAVLAAVGNFDYGWFGGGYGGSGIPNYTTVDRITYATDTATASVRGPLSGIGRRYLAAAGNTTDGWFGGGSSPYPGSGSYTGIPNYTTVDRITYATDTATASVRGPLSLSRYSLAAAGNTTNGWFGGGYAPGPVSTVDRITYATDTATASVRGPLSSARAYLAAAGNTTDGWFGSGWAVYSTVDRITYATDTATASVRGPLSSARFKPAAAGNTTDGWFGGGKLGPPSYANISTVDRITYATDTATASVRGPLSGSIYSMAAAGGVQ